MTPEQASLFQQVASHPKSFEAHQQTTADRVAKELLASFKHYKISPVADRERCLHSEPYLNASYVATSFAQEAARVIFSSQAKSSHARREQSNLEANIIGLLLSDLKQLSQSGQSICRELLDNLAPWQAEFFTALSDRLQQNEFVKKPISAEPAIPRLVELAAESASTFARYNIPEVVKSAKCFTTAVMKQYSLEDLSTNVEQKLISAFKKVGSLAEKFDLGLIHLKLVLTTGNPDGPPEY